MRGLRPPPPPTESRARGFSNDSLKSKIQRIRGRAVYLPISKKSNPNGRGGQAHAKGNREFRFRNCFSRPFVVLYIV